MLELYGIIGVVIIMVIILQYSKTKENVEPATATGLQTQLTKLSDDQDATATTDGADGVTSTDIVKEVVEAKEIIMARSQRRVYGLNGPEADDDNQWVNDIMDRWCVKFDSYMTNMLSLESIANNLCDEIENVVKKHQANLSDFHEQLALLIEVSPSIEEQTKAVPEEQLATNVAPCDKVEPVPSTDPPSFRCSNEATGAEDELLTIYEQFIDDIQGKYL